MDDLERSDREVAFSEWRAAAQKHADDLDVVGGAPLWGQDDEFDLAVASREAFDTGQDPKAFVEEAFAEDLAREALDEVQLSKSLDAAEEVLGQKLAGRYVEVPRQAIVGRLEKAGFTREAVRGEITYVRRHDRDARLLVVVYTSVAEGADAGRGRGQDAIRVLAFFTWTRRGESQVRRKKLYQARVFRVTSVDSVLDRMMERARDAYAACNKWLSEQKGRP